MTLTQLQADVLQIISLTLTTSDYPSPSITLALNKWLRTVTGWVMAATGIWEFSGEKSTTNLVSGQSEYVLPTSMVALNRVAIKYSSSGNFVYAERIDDQETREAFENGTISRGSEASPVFREFDNSIFIYPVPSANVTAGLAIETMEDVTDLSSGSDSPNLNPLIHQVLSMGAAMDYCDSEEMYQKANRLERRIFGRPGGDGKDGMKHMIEVLSANRDRAARQRIIPRQRSYR